MANERKSSGINIGGASIIMVFSVLCLTIFSILTLISANAENKLAQKSADVVSGYYKADSKCTDKLAQIKDTVSKQSSLEGISGAVAELGTTAQLEGSTLYISYSEKINDGQNLSVRLSTDGKTIRILDWKVVNTGDWEPDDNLHVWDGSSPF